MFAFAGIVLGLMMVVAGMLLSDEFGVIAQILLVAAGAVIIFITAVLTAVTKLYRKTTANEAFVRTGMGKAKVVLDGGSFVVPIIHRVVPVSLETMRLNVARRGEEALITGDNLRVDIAAEFFIKVQPEANDILNAARSLGEKSVSEDSIRELVMEKLISALRTVAATKSIIELHTKRDEFASAVQAIVTQDLQENGLTLESVTISSLDQTPLQFLKDDNIFDAQGKRRITEVTQDQLVRRNEIERNAQRDIRQKDVTTRKEVLDMDKDREFAEATQGRDVANVHAERQRETREFAIQQEQEVELAGVIKEKAVQEAEIAKNRDLAVANAHREQAERLAQIERDKAQQEADVAREQAVQTADAERLKAVQVAQRQAEIAVAMEETRRAKAQAETRAAEAKREEETQRIETVKVTVEASRRAEQKMITEKQQVDIKKYQDQIQADVKAYTAVKVAEGDLEAAEKQKQAMLILAEGDAESNKMRAEGQRAKEMVPVQVDRERVDVEAARVEVRRQDLENQERFSSAALDFELKKAQIEANKDVQVQMADAVGRMLASARMQVFGDPTTLSQMYGQFLKSVGWGLTVDGLVTSTPPDVRELATRLLEGTGSTIRDLVHRFAGKAPEVAPEVIEKAIADAITQAKERPKDRPAPSGEAPDEEADPGRGRKKAKDE